jgi:hypothetical protein
VREKKVEQPDRFAGKFWLMADFVQKGPKSGPTSVKFVFLLFISQIIGKSKNYYTFPTDIDKNSFVSECKMLSKVKITSSSIIY